MKHLAVTLAADKSASDKKVEEAKRAAAVVDALLSSVADTIRDAQKVVREFRGGNCNE